MKITIQHNESTIVVDDLSDDTRIKYNHELIADLIDKTMKSTRDHHIGRIPDPIPSKDPEPQPDKHGRLNIAGTAHECLMMLEYWDDHRMVAECGGIVHKRVGDANTMKVVKRFLTSLITNFPK